MRIEPKYSAADEAWAEKIIAECLDNLEDHKIFYDYDSWEDPRFISELLKKVTASTFSMSLKTRINRAKSAISLEFLQPGEAPSETADETTSEPQTNQPPLDMDEDYAALSGMQEPAPANNEPATTSEPERGWMDFLTTNNTARPKQAAVKQGAVTVLPPDPKLKRGGDDRNKQESQNHVLIRDTLRREQRPLSQDELMELTGITHMSGVPKGVREIVVRKKDGSRMVRYALEAG
ncbi:hypothetical protein [Acanthopleuribacter pedis]|uniref:Uncharacterized protein n=1 Tax=Acanthopleuribacter pedis TaxID=442870 RepID=A0A8J7QI46_9BACT|nr:hypothetical protein [Acanthopleuribacter pedis]MBO1320735.1 hypothetical protein [Acanthopleuribacter pedis]